jgi:hypothetical protein
MKKLLASLILLVCLTSPAWSATSTATMTWQQVLPSPITVFGGWEIHMADSAAGTYTLLVSIPYTAPQTTYTATQNITVPDGVSTTRYFKMRAFNKSGKQSAFTAPMSATVDFEAAPSVPITFTITISTP